MRDKTTITVTRLFLAFVGIYVLVNFNGPPEGRALIALVCLAGAIPWGRPTRTAEVKDEEL